MSRLPKTLLKISNPQKQTIHTKQQIVAKNTNKSKHDIKFKDSKAIILDPVGDADVGKTIHSIALDTRLSRDHASHIKLFASLWSTLLGTTDNNEFHLHLFGAIAVHKLGYSVFQTLADEEFNLTLQQQQFNFPTYMLLGLSRPDGNVDHRLLNMTLAHTTLPCIASEAVLDENDELQYVNHITLAIYRIDDSPHHMHDGLQYTSITLPYFDENANLHILRDQINLTQSGDDPGYNPNLVPLFYSADVVMLEQRKIQTTSVARWLLLSDSRTGKLEGLMCFNFISPDRQTLLNIAKYKIPALDLAHLTEHDEDEDEDEDEMPIVDAFAGSKTAAKQSLTTPITKVQ